MKIIKILTTITVLLLAVFITTKPTLAVGELQNLVDAMGSDQDLNIVQFGDESFNATLASFSCALAGCQTTSGETIRQGAIPTANNFIAFMVSEPPVQTGHYVADLLHNSGFIAQPAYAQGIGFSSLSYLLPIWKGFRNIVYFLFVVIFVAIGFMIMFRAQVNPQTVVTIQAALPKLVLTLILVTFSYAIAGFVVDLLYLLTFLVIGFLQQAGVVSNPELTRNTIFGRDVISIGAKYLTGFYETSGLGAQAIANLFQASYWDLLNIVAEPIAFLIIIAAIIIALFRTFFALIGSYIGIIVQTIFAPFLLLPNAFPGSNAFGVWIKNLLANALIFPAIAAFLIIGASLSSSGQSNVESGFGVVSHAPSNQIGYNRSGGFAPPLISDTREQQSIASAQAIVGLGMVLLLPEIAKMIKELFGVKSPMDGLVMQSLGKPFTIPQKAGEWWEGARYFVRPVAKPIAKGVRGISLLIGSIFGP